MNVRKVFIKYVSQNILGMLGVSFYILADTFFISKAVGSDGITALNLVLPVYNVIFAVGAMFGVGSAIRYTISRKRQEKKQEGYFFNAIFWATAIGIVFSAAGLFIPDRLMLLLGADRKIVEVGTSYTRIFMVFAPAFMWNNICNAFVRNDGAPGVAMTATLLSSLFNVVMDYVLMFPLGLGMPGAALATAVSPVVGVCVCASHLLSDKCNVCIKPVRPSFKRLIYSCEVGLSAFVGEISSGVITLAFNYIILGLAGNVGVAAYGVVANVSLVAVAMFNGISQGAQPLLSSFYGNGDREGERKVLVMEIITSLILAAGIIMAVYIWTKPIAGMFNKENNQLLADYAGEGLRLYFTGFLFAGINIVGTGALSASECARPAFIASILRGFAAILVCAFIMSALWGMRGVWLAFPAAEFITVFVTAGALIRCMRRN